jgi:hypothetical protein
VHALAPRRARAGLSGADGARSTRARRDDGVELGYVGESAHRRAWSRRCSTRGFLP